MSGGTVHLRVLDTGDEYDMPEDVAMSAMYDLERSGRKFEANQPPPARGGATIPPSPEGIEPQPYPGSPGAGDQLLSMLRGGYDWVNDKLGPSPEQRQQQLDEATAAGTRGFADPGILRRQLGADIVSGFAAIPGGGFVGGALKGAAAGAAEGYVPNASGADAARAAGLGGILGGTLGGISKSSGEAANDVGQFASRQRLQAAGIGADEIERMKPGAADAMARKIEAEKLHVGPGMLGELPQGPATYFRNARALGQRGNAEMMNAENQITKLPGQPSVPVGNTIDAQRVEADRLRGLADTQANVPQAQFRESLAQGLEDDAATMGPNGELPWQRALEQRRNLDQNVNWNRGMPAVGTAAANDATRKEVAGGLRGAIDSSLSSPSVPPELAQQWRAGRDQFSFASDVADPALKALGRNDDLFIPTGVRSAMGFVARHGGRSALAGAGRGLETALGDTSNLTQLGAQTAGPAGAALQQWMSSKGVKMDTPQQQSVQATASGRGNLLGDAATQLLQTEPGALGKWAPEIARAQQAGNVDQLMVKLDNDPEWRMGPLLRLQQMTKGSNGQQ